MNITLAAILAGLSILLLNIFGGLDYAFPLIMKLFIVVVLDELFRVIFLEYLQMDNFLPMIWYIESIFLIKLVPESFVVFINTAFIFWIEMEIVWWMIGSIHMPKSSNSNNSSQQKV